MGKGHARAGEAFEKIDSKDYRLTFNSYKDDKIRFRLGTLPEEQEFFHCKNTNFKLGCKKELSPSYRKEASNCHRGTEDWSKKNKKVESNNNCEKLNNNNNREAKIRCKESKIGVKEGFHKGSRQKCKELSLETDKTFDENRNGRGFRFNSGTTQSLDSYFKKHLYIKSKVETGVESKVSLRNYTPKALYQELNMGMWI